VKVPSKSSSFARWYTFPDASILVTPDRGVDQVAVEKRVGWETTQYVANIYDLASEATEQREQATEKGKAIAVGDG
jgi:hypothetical protein